jgi:hypothetical protein
MSNENKGGALTPKLAQVLQFFIEGKQFETFHQYLTGAQLKELASIPLAVNLYLAVQTGYEPELIGNEKEVDLARKDIEHFFVKDKLKFTINSEPFTWYEQYISGKQIRVLGKIAEADEIFLQVPAPYHDELITDDREVDLALPGKESFISKAQPFEVTLIVNGQAKKWKEKTISYDQVVILAKQDDPSTGEKAYTITYFDGPPQNPKGELAKSQVVFVTNEMIFNATATDKS